MGQLFCADFLRRLGFRHIKNPFRLSKSSVHLFHLLFLQPQYRGRGHYGRRHSLPALFSLGFDGGRDRQCAGHLRDDLLGWFFDHGVGFFLSAAARTSRFNSCAVSHGIVARAFLWTYSLGLSFDRGFFKKEHSLVPMEVSHAVFGNCSGSNGGRVLGLDLFGGVVPFASARVP